MKLSISSLPLSGLGNQVISGRGGNTPYRDFPVQYQSTTQPEGSFPTIKPDPLPLFSHEEGGQPLWAIFPGYLVGVKDYLREMNESLRIFREWWVPRFTITQIIGWKADKALKGWKGNLQLLGTLEAPLLEGRWALLLTQGNSSWSLCSQSHSILVKGRSVLGRRDYLSLVVWEGGTISLSLGVSRSHTIAFSGGKSTSSFLRWSRQNSQRFQFLGNLIKPRGFRSPTGRA